LFGLTSLIWPVRSDLSGLTFPVSPVRSDLSRLTCLSSPIQGDLFQLIYPGWSIQAVLLADLYSQTCPGWFLPAVCPGCPTWWPLLASCLIPAVWSRLSCHGYPVLVVLYWLPWTEDMELESNEARRDGFRALRNFEVWENFKSYCRISHSWDFSPMDFEEKKIAAYPLIIKYQLLLFTYFYSS
jgi:hypothetical protein